MTLPVVTIYSRATCHLCEVAFDTLVSLQNECEFAIEKVFIDDEVDLIEKYGEQVPVIHINGNAHDFFRVDPERFKAAISAL